jgi:pimeloyl-ACP methyl ester carboxylesterase
MTTNGIATFDLQYAGGEVMTLADGTPLYYDLRGEGPLVTFVNNTFQISPFWRNVTRGLEERCSILCYDLRGQGASGGGGGAVAPVQHVLDLKELLDHLGVETTALVGTSNSTQIARDFAVREHDRIGALVLVGPTFAPNGVRRRRILMEGWLRALRSDGLAGMFRQVYAHVFSDATIERGGEAEYAFFLELFLALNAAAKWETTLAAAIDAVDDLRPLSGIACPVLLMAGDGDIFASRSSLEDLAALFADAAIDVIPNAGHIPFFDEPGQFERLLCAFLAERYVPGWTRGPEAETTGSRP